MKKEFQIALIENPNKIEIIDNKNLSQEQINNQLKTNELILREREEGINTLYNQVQEVSEIFQDLSILVQDQGTHIDNIETNIMEANKNTEKGNKQLVKAQKYQQTYRGYKCIGLCLSTIGLLIIVLYNINLLNF